MTVDLNLVSVFLAVAEAKSFRGAADRLGVTRSAVSQAIRRMEDRMGVALVQRTTRSVSLTEAGLHLHARVAPAIAEVELALGSAQDRDGQPTGLLRLAVSSIAERFISGPLLASFAHAYPGVQVDVTVTDEEFDIVAGGFDAGVRLGEVIAQDMISVPVSGDQRQLVVAAPSYLARFGTPSHPSELSRHCCIGWRPAPDVAPYRWEFEADGRAFDVAVDPRITTNDMWIMVRTACAGGGLTFGMEETFRPFIARGELVPLMEDYLPPFQGFFLYFANRRNLAPKLRALIDHVRYRPERAGGGTTSA
ncbi:LysR family transcriptional regulator [Aquabacter spiritensis]|uniref:LysR family transcriptional regulator n=1 Tax=Aquabacter spiritensis TaxID=933073 RepID=A0A4R3LRM8_9HYPH|nr:LysR family transcriptional regulator [Aquabacter spiritensis]TCT03254.1 LysR family transcriptional regulator [Aquabacter spiritensis]